MHGNLLRKSPQDDSVIVVATLVCSDVLLALLIWWLASALQGVWGKGPLPVSELTHATMVPVIAVWVGLRALLGLYPGYGLDSVEQVRWHTYAVIATMAVLAIFALGFQWGDMLSRPRLVLFFLGLLLLVPDAILREAGTERGWAVGPAGDDPGLGAERGES